jgi:hypothetical protein
VFFEKAWNGIGIVAVQMQRDWGMGIGSSVQHRSDQARVEIGKKLQRAQGRFAAFAQAGGLRVGQEQALVFAQRILDLAIARQRGIVVDAEPLRGLELGLVEVADAAFGHQPGRLVGEAVATFADACLGVLTGMMMHGTTLRV